MKQIIILIALCILIAPYSSAQGWQRLYLEGEDITGMDIIQEADGGFITPCLHKDEVGEVHILLVKTDPEGEVIWTKKLVNDQGRTFPNGMTVCQNGDYLISGGFNHPDFPLVTNGTKPYLTRTDNAGNTIWQQWYGGTPVLNGQTENFEDVIELSNGDFIAAGFYNYVNTPTVDFKTIVTRTDANGDEIWTKIIEDLGLPKKMIQTSDGNFVIVGTDRYNNPTRVALTKIDEDGNQLWTQTYNTTELSQGYSLVESTDKTLMLTGGINNPPPGSSNFTYAGFLLKTTADGDSLDMKIFGNPVWNDQPRDIGTTIDGEYFVVSTRDSLGLNRHTVLTKFDRNGEEIWTNSYGKEASVTNLGLGLAVCENNGVIIAGNFRYDYINDYLYLIKTDALGNTYAHFISGNVKRDFNENCIAEFDEIPFNNWLVSISNPENNFITTTDIAGNYFLEIPAGTYSVVVHPPNPYWEACTPEVMVSLAQPYDTAYVDFEMQATIDCSYLTIDIGTPFIRWCDESYYTLTYCNEGTILAKDMTIEITLDPLLTLDTNGLPIIGQVDNVYTLQAEPLEVSECATFLLNVELGCDPDIQGFTHCTAAHIYPDSLCGNGTWDGPSIEVEGFCDGDSLRFSIHNVGSDMLSSQTYFVIEDHIMLFQGNFQLNGGEDTSIVLYANGATYRLEAEQTPGHPGNSMPSVVIEACGSPFFSLGLVNIFSQNDNDNFVDIDCNTNIFAYDPNDKQGLPLGYGNAHYIYPNTAIDYQIRFQNTGTDTAFHIVVRDTLSPLLDIYSLKMGASSHNYTFDIVDDNILKFTFPDIMLPDSNINEPASHGFLKYKIDHLPDIPLGSEIFNRAGIYFGANLPIITNTTLHTVQENFIEKIILPTVDKYDELKIEVYPNPFTAYSTFKFPEQQINDGDFILYNSSGQIIKQESFSGTQYQLFADELSNGIYFYEIRVDRERRYTGKLIAR